MATPPRILAIMGSGETAPTMAKVHRTLSSHLADPDAPAALVDTPYGFQENADLLSRQISEWFSTHIRRPMSVASYRRADVSETDAAVAVARIRSAPYVMAGPGSPSYALAHWRTSPIPAQLEDKLTHGGIVVMASAAALTVGRLTAPVYEIYKVGADPAWLDGLDLLGHVSGLSAAVIPHYNNTEGRDHDTRYCYIGERRLISLEQLMPPGTFILGVDDHTALIIDLDAQTASVAGRGGVTLRAHGHSAVFPHGETISLAALAEQAGRLQGLPLKPEVPARAPEQLATSGDSLADQARRIEASFGRALTSEDAIGMVTSALDLELVLSHAERGGHDLGDVTAARHIFRSLLVRMGDALRRAVGGTEVVAPYVEALIELRNRARAAEDWHEADLIRDRLLAAGIEIHDEADGATTWTPTRATSGARLA
jgi:cyanophycinase-like exopeptidase